MQAETSLEVTYRELMSQVSSNTLQDFEKCCKESRHADNVPDKTYYFFLPKLAAFLVARDHKVKEAFEMWKQWVSWREETKPYLVTWDQVRLEYLKGKVRFSGRDRRGNLLLYFKGKKHVPGESTVEDLFKMIFYLLEQVEARWRNGDAAKITFINDREGMSMSNIDTAFVSRAKSMVAELQNYYPERVANIVILHPNLLFKTMYAVISPFLSKKTTDKIVVISDLKDILKYADPKCLPPESYGTQQDPFTLVALPKVVPPKPAEKPGFFSSIFGSSSDKEQPSQGQTPAGVAQPPPFPADHELPLALTSLFHFVELHDQQAL
jgi:hypothetical protein